MDFHDTIYTGIGTNILYNNDINNFIKEISQRNKYSFEDVNNIIKKYETNISINSKIQNDLEKINAFLK